jgi:hypothetical protein
LRGQEASQLFAELPVAFADGATKQAYALLSSRGTFVERMKDDKIAAGSLEAATLQALLEELLRRREISEECAPGARLRLARALDDNVEILWKIGEQAQHARQKRSLGLRRRVNLLVEDVVEEDLERVGEVCQVLVLVC